MIIEYAGGPSLALNLCKKHQIGYAGVHSYSCTCMTYAHTRVNLYEMSTYKSR